SNCEHFEIELKQVHEWCNKKQELLNAVLYALTLNIVSKNIVVKKAKALAWTDEIKNTYSNITSFKFSIFWLSQFLCHNNLSNCRCTTIMQYLLAALTKKQSKFLSLILFKCNQYNYPVRYIGNINETSLVFDMPSLVILEKCRAKTVSIRTTRHEKAYFTVILRYLADRMKLLP
ncbi:10989_t:CDS:2, partial [Scutellospora calospora]